MLGVVFAQHAAVPGQGVLVQVPGRLGLAQRGQVDGEVAGGAERVGVVLAQHAAVPGQGVLVQFPGRLGLAQRAQVDGEVVGGA